MQSLEQLQTQFALPGALHFEAGAGRLPFAVIQTLQAQARLCLQGAHLVAWQPAGHRPVIWLSPTAVFAPGQAIRGGIPICWPWFGTLPQRGAHGFARNRTWRLRSSAVLDDGSVQLCLQLTDDDQSRALWNHAFTLELDCLIGQNLSLRLRTLNRDRLPLPITQALHTYLAVGDISQTRVLGLEDCLYQDKLRDFAWDRQRGPVTFSAETDRVYADAAESCVIEDLAWQRRIRVAKQGSRSTVVWNPWLARAAAMSDMPSESFRDMLCVETSNAGVDQVMVGVGDEHLIAAQISVEKTRP